MEGDNPNSSSNPQKLEFQDKGEEESDKVEKNILAVLVSSRTAVTIRVKIEAIKGGGEVKKKGIRKIFWGKEIERER